MVVRTATLMINNDSDRDTRAPTASGRVSDGSIPPASGDFLTGGEVLSDQGTTVRIAAMIISTDEDVYGVAPWAS